jgi:hypothetical protein
MQGYQLVVNNREMGRYSSFTSARLCACEIVGVYKIIDLSDGEVVDYGTTEKWEE